ncbi:MAG: cysteine desulfurase family protein [bacterium]|nr:cysteine desulfurase family protein [bacterium]
MKMKEVYLDYAASTPVDPRVEEAMKPYLGGVFGNPHSMHRFGQKASRAVFESRKAIAESIGAHYEDIIFTGSATEANNLAIRGLVSGVLASRKFSKPRIITLAIEHESILSTCQALSLNVETIFIPVDKNGFVNLKKFKEALNDQTVLVSIMHANNEVGTIQPIAAIAAEIRNWKLEIKSDLFPIFHTDAAQSFQYLDCQVENLGVDLMTLSAHKIYGPKGIGLLYAGKNAREIMKPVITGAGQEGGLRSGTDNVPYIVAFAKAVEIADKLREKESRRIGELRDYFWVKLEKALGLKKVVLNGVMRDRLPNNLNLYFLKQKAHDLLIKLDLLGIAVSPGAACSARVAKASYVLEELGFSEARASGSLRFSLGRQTSKDDIDYVISATCTSLIKTKRDGIIKVLDR